MTEEKKTDPTLPYKIWLAGLGALSQAQEEGSDLFQNLTERGRQVVSNRTSRVKDEVSKLGAWFDSTMGKLSDGIDQRVKGLFRAAGIPAQEDVENLSRKIDELDEQLRKAAQEPVGEAAVAAAPVVLHVQGHDDGWQVLREGSKEPESVHRTKPDAVAAARKLAQAEAPSRLVVHRRDGATQNETEYS
jgi:poly(hydroxyalkanoate) granule-associated protein